MSITIGEVPSVGMEPGVEHESWRSPNAGDDHTLWSEGHRLHISCRGEERSTHEEIVFEIERRPDAGRMAFRAAVVRHGQPIVGMVETRIAAPAHGWEIRASGLWADHICEDPMVHWSYGLEAFAIGVDGVDELTESGFGDRVPIGWELEFEADGDPFWGTSDRHYLQPGVAHGIMLDKQGDREVTGVATRHHWWGDGLADAPQPFIATVDSSVRALS